MENKSIFDPSHRSRIELLGTGIFRITHARENDPLPRFNDPAWFADVIMLEEKGTEEDEYTAEFIDNLALIKDVNGKIVFQEKHSGYRGKRGTLGFTKTGKELFFGLGEWFHQFGIHEGNFKLINRESPEFLQIHQTYSTIPVLLSSHSYLIFLLNGHPSDWSIEKEEIKISVNGGKLDFLVCFAENPKSLIEKYTKITGRPRLIPRWAFGLWATSYPQEAQFKVLQFARTHREKQIPLDVLVMDYHWEDRFHNFKWRQKLFPAPELLLSNLKEMGIKTGLILTPFENHKNLKIKKRILNLLFKDVSNGCINDDERAMEEYDEAKKGAYLAHEDVEWWFGKGGMLDFTNPETIQWWNAKMEPLYRSGISLFKNDDGEYLPQKAHSHIGLDREEYHNLYGFYYGKAIYENMEKLDDRRGLIFSRCVWAGSQRFPAIFLGDQHPDFENIKKTIRAGLNMSVLGFSYWGADIFGLDGKVTPEAHMRYTQWAIFSPIARYFYRPENIDPSRQPWLQEKEVENHFRDMVNFRYRLLPYYYSCAWAAFEKGTPIIRPLFLEFPEDEKAWNVDDEVMIGSTLLLAPVVTPGAISRSVYFPEGDWFDVWGNTIYKGKQFVEIQVPLNKVALFARSGTALALGPAMASIGEKHGFSQVELHFFDSMNAQFTLYDDDGQTRAYLSGAVLETRIDLKVEKENSILWIKPALNEYSPDFTKRVYSFVLHHFNRPESIYYGLNQEISLPFVYEEGSGNIHFVLETMVEIEYILVIKNKRDGG